MSVEAEPFVVNMDQVNQTLVPIDGQPKGKDLLSITQFGREDITLYINEATAAASLLPDDPAIDPGIDLLPRRQLTALMRQPSTRTGGSMMKAMTALGGQTNLISGMESSSEAKGESPMDSTIALATQSDIFGTRTEEEFGPHMAAYWIGEMYKAGKLHRCPPVINLGDGTNEHPTQTLGDLFTIYKHFTGFEDITVAMVGDQERYRAFHSLALAAHLLGINVISVETTAAPMPNKYKQLLGDQLVGTTLSIEEAMRDADVLYVGRNPDEYTGSDPAEKRRAARLAGAYEGLDISDGVGRPSHTKGWRVDRERLQIMHPDAILMHPRPRRNEVSADVDLDPRAVDVSQMEDVTIMRMAIQALHLGKSILAAIEARR